MQSSFIDPVAVPRTADLTQAVRVGDFVFCSGQIGIGPEGKMVDPRDVRAQMVQAFKNLRIVLEQAGASLHHVVKITSYLLDDADRDFLIAVRQRCSDHPTPRALS